MRKVNSPLEYTTKDYTAEKKMSRMFEKLLNNGDYKRAYSILLEFPDLANHLSLGEIDVYYGDLREHLGAEQAETLRKICLDYISEMDQREKWLEDSFKELKASVDKPLSEEDHNRLWVGVQKRISKQEKRKKIPKA